MNDLEYTEDKRRRRQEEKSRLMVARNIHVFDKVAGPTEMLKDLQEADFCMANLPTAATRQGHAQSLLRMRCSYIWDQHAFRLEQVCDQYTDAGTESTCRAAVAGATQSQHEPKEAEWHLPVDSDTLDDAFHHCGISVKQSSEWTSNERYNRNRAEWEMVCWRNKRSPMPGGAGVAIARSCASVGKDNALGRLTGTSGGVIYDLDLCLCRHLAGRLPGQTGHPKHDVTPSH